MDQLIAHEAQEVRCLDIPWIIALETLQTLVFYTYICISYLFSIGYSESNVSRTSYIITANTLRKKFLYKTFTEESKIWWWLYNVNVLFSTELYP